MNTSRAPLVIDGAAVFVSDLHLSEDAPERTAQFMRFTAGLARLSARALFILGDLFDAWPGDDILEDPFAARISALLKSIEADGIAVYFMAGNRDFLIGSRFASASGVHILSDPSLVHAGDTPLLLAHGDAYCTDDAAYQHFRRQVRDSAWQSEFLAQPLLQRQGIAAEMRHASESAKAQKPIEIMDVNQEAVAAAMLEHRQATLVHGHTHRPGTYPVMVDGERCERWVLPDWEVTAEAERGGGVLARDGHLEWLDLHARPRGASGLAR